MQRIQSPPYGHMHSHHNPFPHDTMTRAPYMPHSFHTPYPLHGPIEHVPQMTRDKNILSRLFGGGQSVGSAGGMDLMKMLTNTQRIIGVTRQVAPLVQQYGPLVRNLPAIWQILRQPDEPSPSLPSAKQPISISSEEAIELKDEQNTINGLPTPKLYI